VGRAELERHLMFVAEVDGLCEPTALHIPEVQPMTVLAAEQQLRHNAVFDHRRGRPLRGDEDVVVDVPPDVVGKILVVALFLELADHIERGVVEQRHTARSVGSVGSAQAGQVQVAGAAVHGVRARVTRALGKLVGLKSPCDRWLGGAVLGVEYVNPG
jgi:hypothetical protein